uniref:Androgen dependent TFPI regulating protein 1 n=1 Tax=Astyanax mexicanus TaxID=7994 RepID=A0A3B1IV99_ASTMX
MMAGGSVLRALLLHVLIFGWYVFTLRENCGLDFKGRHPGVRTYGGRWKYLTFLNLVMQTVFFGFCLFTDLVLAVLPSKNTRSGVPLFLIKVRDGFFTVLAFPVGTFVFISFWALYTIDRELVYPKYLDELIPIWLNHAMHTVILPLVLIQMYIQHHRHPSRLNGILGLALFASLYLLLTTAMVLLSLGGEYTRLYSVLVCVYHVKTNYAGEKKEHLDLNKTSITAAQHLTKHFQRKGKKNLITLKSIGHAVQSVIKLIKRLKDKIDTIYDEV